MVQNNFQGKLQKLFDNLFIDKQKGICELKCYSESNDMSKKDNNENR